MRILLVSSRIEDIEFFQGAAKVAQLSIIKVPSPLAACEELRKDPQALVVLDASTLEQYQAFEKCLAEKFGLYSADLDPNRLFYVASGEFHEAPYLIKSDIFGHFIHRSFTADDQGLIGRIFAMVGAERAFGLEHYFTEDAQKQSMTITKSLQKKTIVESLKNHLVNIGFKSRMAGIIATATDELIMNAIFDAPIDEAGKRIYSQTPRSAAIDLDEKNTVEMKVYHDAATLGISIIDQHGSLDKKKLLAQHLGKSYESDEYKTQATVGAGLGLAHVFRNCGGLIFSCESGGRTEVNLFYRKTESFRAFKDQFRFLSTFMYFS